MFRHQMKLSLFAVLAACTLALTGCGGGGGGGDDPPMMPDPPDPQMVCEDAGGRYNADGSCTSAEQLVMERQEMQRNAITTAIGTATTAVNAVNNDSTDAEVSAADTAIGNARSAIMAAADLPQAERDANTGTVNALATQLGNAKTARMDAMDEDDRIAREAMAADAAKLYAGIGTTPLLATGDGARSAAYSGTNDADITVTMDDAAVGDGTDITQVLKATTKTVAANRGWEGKQYMASGRGVNGTYEAYVYSNVGAPTQGKKFGNAEPGDVYQYTLVSGMLTIDASTTAAHAARVGGSSFDHTAGVKRFPLPSPNPSGATKVSVPGSFHGVSGSYTCTPTDNTVTCAASKTATGFNPWAED